MKGSSARWFRRSRFSLALVGFVLLALVCLFRSRYGLTMVVGDSMRPTLKTGELLLLDERAYDEAPPRRGDIVVVRSAGSLLVKRVVGLPGEDVEVRDGRLYINGSLEREDHPIDSGPLSVGKGHLLEGDFATLGDNRAVPAALAVHPIVPRADIVGKVVLVVWP